MRDDGPNIAKAGSRPVPGGSPAGAPATGAATVDGVDLVRYWHHLADLDLSDDEKTELLMALWLIMQSFVDRAFGLDPVQQVRHDVPVPDGQAPSPPEDNSTADNASGDCAVVDFAITTTPENPKALAGSFRSSSGGGRRKTPTP